MEQNKERTPYLYTLVPFQLLRCHQLLNRTDRDVLIQIIAFGKKSCYYAVDKWTEEVLGTGEDAFYRSIYKLRFLGLIDFKKGKRGRSSFYFYNSDPRLWILPKEIETLLQADRAKLGLEPILFVHNGFENYNHFVNAFNKKYPRYAIKNKDPKPINEEDADWLKKLENIKSIHHTDAKTVYDFYIYKNQIIQKNKGQTEQMLPIQKKYLKYLERAFIKLNKKPTSRFIANMLNIAEELEKEGLAGEKIKQALKSRTTTDDNGDRSIQ
jgi:hypothetical protein